MKKVFNIVGIVILSCLAGFFGLFFIVGIATSTMDMATFGGISAAILLIPDIILINKQSKLSKSVQNFNIESPTKNRKTYKEKVIENHKKYEEKYGREAFFHNIKYKFTHVLGLPVMQGAVCNVRSEHDKITIETQGTVLTLNKDHITYIGKENNIQTYAQAVSSVGGAVAGGMLFGGIGAAIGGSVKSRNFKSRRQYLVITYIGDDEAVKYVVFDYIPRAKTLINDFKLFNKSNLQKRNVEIK